MPETGPRQNFTTAICFNAAQHNPLHTATHRPKAAKATVFAPVVPSGGCTYSIVTIDNAQAPGWRSGDPITFDESVTIGYTCTFGATQLPAGGTLRGTTWAYIFDLMDMKYTYIATKTIPR